MKSIKKFLDKKENEIMLRKVLLKNVLSDKNIIILLGAFLASAYIIALIYLTL